MMDREGEIRMIVFVFFTNRNLIVFAPFVFTNDVYVNWM